jgi:predicted transcriptional regulator
MESLEQSERVLTVRDLMTETIISLSAKKNVMDAAQKMEKKDLSSILVKDDSEYIGIVTDRDIITRVVLKELNPRNTRIGNVMSSPLITISAEASLESAAEAMRRHKIRRLVVKENNHIIGIITESDIVRIAPEFHRLIRENTTLQTLLQTQNIPERSNSGFCEECGNHTTNLRPSNGEYLCEDCYDN